MELTASVPNRDGGAQLVQDPRFEQGCHVYMSSIMAANLLAMYTRGRIPALPQAQRRLPRVAHDRPGLLRLTLALPYLIVRHESSERAMPTATLTSKGQITIPAPVRTALGVEAGDRVEFVEVEPGRFELVAATQSVTALKGLVRKPKVPVTIEAMNAVIAAQGAKAAR